MINNTINGAKTIAASDKGSILTGRYSILSQFGASGMKSLTLKLGAK